MLTNRSPVNKANNAPLVNSDLKIRLMITSVYLDVTERYVYCAFVIFVRHLAAVLPDTLSNYILPTIVCLFVMIMFLQDCDVVCDSLFPYQCCTKAGSLCHCRSKHQAGGEAFPQPPFYQSDMVSIVSYKSSLHYLQMLLSAYLTISVYFV